MADQERPAKRQRGEASSSGTRGRGRGRGGKVIFLKPEISQSDVEKLTVSRPQNQRTTCGTMVPVVTNYFRMELDGNAQYHMYEVDVQPPRPYLFDRLLSPVKAQLGVFVFDGRTLICKTPFSGLKIGEEHSYTMEVRRRFDEREEADYDREFDVLTVKIKYTHSVGRDQNVLDCGVLQIVGNIYRRLTKSLGLKIMNKHYFDPAPVTTVHIGRMPAEVWRGYSSSFLMTERGPCLNIDLKSKIIRGETALDRIADLRASGLDWKQISRRLKDETVVTRYNNNSYRIRGIIENKNPTSTFKMTDRATQERVEIRFMDYYKQHYNLTVTDQQQPLISASYTSRTGKVNKVKLIPEFCTMTGVSAQELSACRRALIVDPQARANALRTFMKNVTENTDNRRRAKIQEAFDMWGMSINPKPEQIDACVLPIEDIRFRNRDGSVQVVKDCEWQRNLKNVRLYSPVEFKRIVLFYHHREDRTAETLESDIRLVSGPLGVSLEGVKRVSYRDGEELSALIDNQKEAMLQADMIIVILPDSKDNGDQIYRAIKSTLITNVPVPCQMCKPTTLRKGKSVATNIVLQMQAKSKAELWSVQNLPPNTMIIGIDVNKDSSEPSGGRKSSVLGFCATLDANATQYFSDVSFVESTEEAINFIGQALERALHAYKQRNNGSLPKGIIVYRDGVSDGNLHNLIKNEIAAMKSKFATVLAGYQPPFAYITVNKQVNQRFFAVRNDQLVNPEVGTVIDHGITRNNIFEFFLISAKARAGTVNPVKYTVVENSTKLATSRFTLLTFKLCHMYYNWSGTVKVPSPVMYARKLAQLVTSTHRNVRPNESLADRLYFI